MENEELKTSIQSPCIDNCCLDDEDICLGCFRSIHEILVWRASTDVQRSAILQQTAIRRK
jgi:predicted Fe-S protein YdhL (DUF1289 family)